MAVVNLGLENRVMAPTMMNDTSSRSHTVLAITLEQRVQTSPAQLRHQNHQVYSVHSEHAQYTDAHILLSQSKPSLQVVRSKLTMVDLAGSERVRKTQSDGMRLEEAKSINQSLSALGNVIAALTEASTLHIPFRDSKLTRLLQVLTPILLDSQVFTLSLSLSSYFMFAGLSGW